MSFTIKDIAELREKTSCGIMDCRNALKATEGNVDMAVEFLREKGLASANKKSSRIAAEGISYTCTNEDGSVAVLIEVNSETDFVSKNKDFQKFVALCANTVMQKNPLDVEALLAMEALDSNETIGAILKEKILTIGENIKIRRFARLEGTVVCYIHAEGRIGVIVQFDTSEDIADKAEFKEYAKNIAMQIAAINPTYLNVASVSAKTVEYEKKILKEQVINDGKAEEVASKIVKGRMDKFFKENCLLEQKYIKDNDMTVAQYTESIAKILGGTIVITNFVRFEKGEGIKKNTDNFADKVANMMK